MVTPLVEGKGSEGQLTPCQLELSGGHQQSPLVPVQIQCISTLFWIYGIIPQSAGKYFHKWMISIRKPVLWQGIHMAITPKNSCQALALPTSHCVTSVVAQSSEWPYKPTQVQCELKIISKNLFSLRWCSLTGRNNTLGRQVSLNGFCYSSFEYKISPHVNKKACWKDEC